MAQETKRNKQIREIEGYDPQKVYSLDEAISLIKQMAKAKFDETVEFHANLGIDPKKADQQVRGTLSLPHGTGKNIRIAVFAEGDDAAAAKEAGADVVGSDDLVEKINGGFMDFDLAIASPDMMRHVGKLGKVLGPRGLMPNPKTGTVTKDIANAVKEFKAGRIEYRADKAGGVHVPVGKASFTEDQLKENLRLILNTLMRVKPSSAKGTYLKSCFISSTMGPGIRLDASSFKASKEAA